MPYAAESDLDAKWGAELVTLAAWNPATSARDEGRIAVALGAAAAVMDGYFARRYPLPLAPSAGGALLLTNINCDLAMGLLSNTPGTRNEIVAEAEKRALSFLRDVGDGKAAIPLLPSAAEPQVAPNEPVLIADRHEWARDRMRAL
ncbi:MAG: phage protein Gp36 family protein [Roseiarcus sp.]|jgi:phage gp36-like protein